MRYVVRPISNRTRFTGKHVRSPFSATWSTTHRQLLASTALIRANARPATPAARVAFESVHGPLTYATDRFTRWQDNVRAIALGLEALRKVDRYGITKSGEQYAGWKQLPSGSGSSSHMTSDEAVSILCSFTDLTAAEVRASDLRWVHRTARGRAHPDKHDGDRTFWDQVEQAARMLGGTSR